MLDIDRKRLTRARCMTLHHTHTRARNRILSIISMCIAVSYTHLDVYKRQSVYTLRAFFSFSL